ncbi:snaclec flavocetin-A subunit beta-like [Paroedura picta]|uniref:snaclec flavocetin-A subunit beta-like n=1 Tax=Paroedura picta TaxID=143630 RepID=UPI004057B918
MGQVVYLGLCLLGCLLLNPSVEGAQDATVAAKSLCPNGVFYFQEHCYEISPPRSFQDAENKCLLLTRGAELAYHLSPREKRVILAYLIRQEDLNNIWLDLRSAPVDTDSSSKCISLSLSDDLQWEETDCSTKLPSVCKYRSFFG